MQRPSPTPPTLRRPTSTTTSTSKINTALCRAWKLLVIPWSNCNHFRCRHIPRFSMSSNTTVSPSLSASSIMSYPIRLTHFTWIGFIAPVLVSFMNLGQWRLHWEIISNIIKFPVAVAVKCASFATVCFVNFSLSPTYQLVSGSFIW